MEAVGDFDKAGKEVFGVRERRKMLKKLVFFSFA